MSRIHRTLGLALLTCIVVGLLASASSAKPPRRIGLLAAGSARDVGPSSEVGKAFTTALRERGYVEGQNLVIDRSYWEGRLSQLPQLAQDLVALQPDVIVAASTRAALAVKHATSAIPIVFLQVQDAVESGLVASTARPGANLTGVSTDGGDAALERLRVLREVLPAARDVAVLGNPTNPGWAIGSAQIEGAARGLAIRLRKYTVESRGEFTAAFAAMKRDGVQAVLVLPDVVFTTSGHRLANLAVEDQLPTVFVARHFAEAGGLISYAASVPEQYRRAAGFVDRILRGARPADLPVEGPTAFELVINLRTARLLGLTIAKPVLLRANALID